MEFRWTAKDMEELDRSLRNEYLYLWNNQYILNDWQKKRLVELSYIGETV